MQVLAGAAATAYAAGLLLPIISGIAAIYPCCSHLGCAAAGVPLVQVLTSAAAADASSSGLAGRPRCPSSTLKITCLCNADHMSLVSISSAS